MTLTWLVRRSVTEFVNQQFIYRRHEFCQHYCLDVSHTTHHPARITNCMWFQKTLLSIHFQSFAVRESYWLAQMEYSLMKVTAVSWALFTIITVAIMNIHSIAGFLMRNVSNFIFTIISHVYLKAHKHVHVQVFSRCSNHFHRHHHHFSQELPNAG